MDEEMDKEWTIIGERRQLSSLSVLELREYANRLEQTANTTFPKKEDRKPFYVKAGEVRAYIATREPQ